GARPTDVQLRRAVDAQGLLRLHRPRRRDLPLHRERSRGAPHGQEGLRVRRSRRHLCRCAERDRDELRAPVSLLPRHHGHRVRVRRGARDGRRVPDRRIGGGSRGDRATHGRVTAGRVKTGARTMANRELQRTIEGVATSDGAGVKLRRSLGSVRGLYLDPFLMLDEFSSDDAADYIAGFPSHPHRGFETVTYMLDGHMRHEDHLGHRGELTSGGVQWMTAGRGIIHSEMPQQDRGRMRGFQLWINLPRREKMKPAKYRDIAAREIPVVEVPGGGRVKVIAGKITVDGREVGGPIQGLTTDPTYLDVELPAGAVFRHSLASDYTAFVYAFEGSVEIGAEGRSKTLGAHRAGVTSKGEEILLRGGDQGGRALLIAGRPLRAPIVQYGPFVMTTSEG